MSVELILGCMFSGKTTELIRRIRRAKVGGFPVKMYKYAGDTRYNRKHLATSHDGVEEMAQPIHSASEISTSETQITVIGIDEGQFIKGLAQCADALAKCGHTVIISALNSTYQRQPFEEIEKLWYSVDKLHHLNAICVKCKGDACYSKRVVDGSMEELIGGVDMYEARCRACWDM